MTPHIPEEDHQRAVIGGEALIATFCRPPPANQQRYEQRCSKQSYLRSQRKNQCWICGVPSPALVHGDQPGTKAFPGSGRLS